MMTPSGRICLGIMCRMPRRPNSSSQEARTRKRREMSLRLRRRRAHRAATSGPLSSTAPRPWKKPPSSRRVKGAAMLVQTVSMCADTSREGAFSGPAARRTQGRPGAASYLLAKMPLSCAQRSRNDPTRSSPVVPAGAWEKPGFTLGNATSSRSSELAYSSSTVMVFRSFPWRWMDDFLSG